jgi:hypothetical protein
MLMHTHTTSSRYECSCLPYFRVELMVGGSVGNDSSHHYNQQHLKPRSPLQQPTLHIGFATSYTIKLDHRSQSRNQNEPDE